jgi:small subunit ribosomal protein S18
MSDRGQDMFDDKDPAGRGEGGDAPRRSGRKAMKKFFAEKALTIDYKDPQSLRYFVTERGRIVPRRISGLSARQQRKVTVAIKQARHLALLPFTVSH